MAAQQPQLGYLQETVQAASAQPSLSLQNAVINQMAQERQLNDLQRQAIFEAAKVQDVSRINQAQSFFSALLNEATGGLTQEITPENPNQGIPNAAAHLGAGIGIPLALTVGTALTGPVGLAAAPFVPGAYNALKGVARSYSEAQNLGEKWSPGWGLARGAAEGALTYLPVNKAKQGLGLAGQLAKNAGIAGLAEGVLSAGSQAAQTGIISGQRLLGDVVGSIGGQVGGDVLERFGGLFKIASRQQQAADVAKQVASQLGLKKRADLAPSVKVQANPVDAVRADESVTGRIVPRNEILAAENDQAAVFQNRINQMQQLAMVNPAGAKKQAELLMRQANLQASRAAEGSPEQVMFRQQARTVKQFLNAQAASKKGDAQLTELEAHRGTVADYEADGNSKQLMTLARLGRNKKVSGATPEARLEAAQLEKDAIEAMQRMGVTPEQVKAQKAAAKKTVSPEEKAIQNVEAIEGRYKLAVGEGGSKIDDGTADVKTLNKLRTAAANVETDPKAPEWLRSYSSQLKAQIDEDLSAIKTQKMEAQELAKLQKAIKDAQARTARAEQQQADKDRGVGLSRLKEDITTRAAEDAKVAKQQAKEKAKLDKAVEDAKARVAKAEQARIEKERGIGLSRLKEDITARSKAEKKAADDNLKAALKAQADYNKQQQQKKIEADRAALKEANKPNPEAASVAKVQDAAKRLTNIVGPQKKRIESGEATTTEARSVRNQMAKIETDPNLPMSVRAQAKKVREAADQAIQLITAKSTAKRKQTVAESKKGVTTEKARIAKKFKPYEQQLDQKHEGMSETPRQIQQKLDNAADTGDVYEVNYYAEKAGASQEKEFLQRFLTIEGTGVDNAGRRYYITVDQVNGTKETRKLFDGPEDSRITLATKTEKPLRYILDPDGNVVDLTTGDVVARTPVERMTTSEQQKALAEATEVGTVARRLQAAAELSQKISENGSKPQETYRVIRKLSQSSRRQMSKDIKGVDC